MKLSIVKSLSAEDFTEDHVDTTDNSSAESSTEEVQGASSTTRSRFHMPELYTVFNEALMIKSSLVAVKLDVPMSPVAKLFSLDKVKMFVLCQLCNFLAWLVRASDNSRV